MKNEIKPWLTAIHRKKESVPMRKLIDSSEILKTDLILDYGCGHGSDINWLSSLGYDAKGFDKFLQPYSNNEYIKSILLPKTYTAITCFYVLNVIPTIEERIQVLTDLAGLVKENGNIFIAVRSEYEFLRNASKSQYSEYNDGIVTRKNTFQKYFSEDSLNKLITQAIPDCNISYIPFNKNTLFVKINVRR